MFSLSRQKLIKLINDLANPSDVTQFDNGKAGS